MPEKRSFHGKFGCHDNETLQIHSGLRFDKILRHIEVQVKPVPTWDLQGRRFVGEGLL